MPCLNTIQFIFGCDAHKTIPPPPPATVYAPHVVAWGVGWSQNMNFMWSNTITSKASSPQSGVKKPVQACYGYTIGRTHDSGPHPAHFWANALLPVIMLGSASKHEFGSGTVKVPGGFDMAIGVAFVVDLGVDCFDFPLPSSPTGLAITAACTVRAGFTWSDFFRGLAQMIWDIGVAWLIAGALTWAGAALTGGLKGSLGRAREFHSVFSKGAPNFFARNGRFFVDAIRAMRPALVHAFTKEGAAMAANIATPIVALFCGGTLGTAVQMHDEHGNPLGGAYGKFAGGPADETINELFKPESDEKKKEP
jgi:hypothetical protein